MDPEEMSILTTEIETPIGSEGISLLRTPSKSCISGCAFSREEINASESRERSKSAAKLGGLMLFYLLVMVVEIVGGLKANSLAVISDAGHLLTDVAGFAVSLFSVWASGWEATQRHSFGYHRLEILGALVSVQLIWAVSGVLIYEAVNRLLNKSERVNGVLMFAIAAFGFVVNLVMVVWLGHHHSHSHHHHDHHGCAHDHERDHEKEEVCSSPAHKPEMLNINIRGAYLHVVVDMIQSVGVMIAGAVIWVKPGWLVFDLICTLIFSVLSLSTTMSMLKSIYGVLMEQTPSEIDIAKLEKDLKLIKGVEEVHDLHVWALTVGKVVLSCHVSAEPEVNSRLVVHKIRDYCEKRHKIHHVTVQVE